MSAQYYRVSYRILTLLSLLFVCCGFKPPPQLSKHDVFQKLEEIFSAHVTYHEFTEEIAKRSLKNFIEELDFLKSYFLLGEIQEYIQPDEALIHQVMTDYKKQYFTVYQEIYDKMIVAIDRRNRLEDQVNEEKIADKEKLPNNEVWASSEKELLERLQGARTLQNKALINCPSQDKDLFFQRIKKRRLAREKQIACSTPGEQKKQIYTIFLKSVARSLDAHTAFFTPDEARQFIAQVQQKLSGIGIQLRDDIKGLRIIRIIEGGPASFLPELKEGDFIVAVNNETIYEMEMAEAVELIRGPTGTSVSLTILREPYSRESDREVFDVKLCREDIVIADNRYSSKVDHVGNGVIATLALHSFYQDDKTSSTKDIKNTLEALKREHNLLGVILDLRNNAGGILQEAIGVSSLFMKRGIVVSIQDNKKRLQHLRNLNNAQIWDGPLLILVSRASASAAEIVTSSLSDYGRAIIVGDQSTFGKGSYQTFTLESHATLSINQTGEYKVTRGIYYPVGGKSPQYKGVKADIPLPSLYDSLEIGERYNEYSLQPQEIAAHFIDELDDIHPLYRSKIRKLLDEGVQEKTALYTQFIPQLQENARQRVTRNPYFQKIIKYCQNKQDPYKQDIDIGQNDLHQEEAVRLLIDLLFLTQTQASP